MGEPGLETLRMVCAHGAADAALNADCEGNLQLST